MAIVLYRIDDRLIHGQVVVGWGKPLNAGVIVVVDDVLAESEWEQELYRMGVPPHMDVAFIGVNDVAATYGRLVADKRPAILLTGDTTTMLHVVDALPRTNGSEAPAVNVGGLHHAAGRTQKLRYVFLTESDEQALRDIAARGVQVTAQDLPTTRPVPLDVILAGEQS